MLERARSLVCSRSTSFLRDITWLERVPAERLRPGDVWFLNLPEVGGNHLPDVKAIRPIFLEGRLFAFAVSLAHWGDIGGAWAGSYFAAATETWQEGVRLADAAGVGTLAIFHHDPSHNDAFMDDVAREAAALRPGTVAGGLPRVIVAHEGLTLAP